MRKTRTRIGLPKGRDGKSPEKAVGRLKVRRRAQPRKMVALLGGSEGERAIWRLRLGLWHYAVLEYGVVSELLERLGSCRKPAVVLALGSGEREELVRDLELIRANGLRLVKVLLVGEMHEGDELWWDQRIAGSSPTEVRERIVRMLAGGAMNPKPSGGGEAPIGRIA